MKHPFRKKWGQNFLRDQNIITKIIDCLNLKINDNILEIGPGDGALTNHIVEKVHTFHSVEIDPYLIKNLNKKEYHNAIFHEADILKWDFNILPNNIKIIGNLPYNISSPILFRLLEVKNWKRMVLMFQKEVAQRIISHHKVKSYGRLSIMCQTYCHVNIKFIVPRNVFEPRPKVDSAVVIFKRKIGNLPEIEQFSMFIKKAFSQRRKKLKNNLPDAYDKGLLKKWADLRPEDLAPEDYLHLFTRI